ncbi:MAG: MFS transporter, partial [Dehalococcoidia bacterium]
MRTADQQHAAAPGSEGRGHAPAAARRWAALPVILAGTFMTILDFFIVNVAIPAMQRDLHAGSGAIEFVVAGYGLAYAAGLITGGRLGDLYGRRRMFALGLALFTLTSAGCGLAPNASVLVIARIGQGLAAALLAPQVLSMLGIVYTGEDRARAFTFYGLVLGLAAVGGQLLGGLLIQADFAGLSWRTCFLINVPIGAVALVLTPRLVPESRAEGCSRLDLIGTALVTLGMVAIVLPLVEGRRQGWPLWAWLGLASALPLLLAFGLYQRRLSARGQTPLVDLTLFGERAFAVGIVAILVFYAGIASFFFVFTLYMQQGRGLDALNSGAIFTPIGLGFCATSMSTRWIANWFGRQSMA